MTATVVPFGEWLPDQPDHGHQGLSVALNVLPDSQHYRPYAPLSSYSGGGYSLPGAAKGFFSAVDVDVPRFYAGTATVLYMQSAGSLAARSGALSSTSFDWSFAQIDNLVFAVNGAVAVYHTVGDAGNFATVTGAPAGQVVGTLGQFVIIGCYSGGGNSIQWSAIDDPTNWPTPNSATAIAKQAGEQALNSTFGQVRAIIGGDQFGLVFQDFGITRMTYVGPPAVFQFDEIDRAHGLLVGTGAIRVGQIVYFKARDGFFMTDGVNVTPIGTGKVDRTFLDDFGGNAIIRTLFDEKKRCVIWSYTASGSSTPDFAYAYNVDSQRWTKIAEQMGPLDPSPIGSWFGPFAFDENNIVCTFTGTPGTATIATADAEFNPGGRAYVGGVKPNIEASSAPTVTVRMGTRNDLTSSPTYTAATSLTSRTGFADFRSDAKYHRAEVSITGNFNKAVGLEFRASPSGEA